MAHRDRQARDARVERKPLFAVVVTVVFFVPLYLPILAVALFCFNDKKSLRRSRASSLQLVRGVRQRRRAAQLSRGEPRDRRRSRCSGRIVLGTMLALGLGGSARDGPASSANALMLIPLVTPEIVTGVAALLLFTGIGLSSSLTTVILARSRSRSPT